MTFLDRNLKTIEENKPYFYARLAEHNAENDRNRLHHIEIVQTLDKNTTLIINADTGVFRINSIYSPVHEAARWGLQYDMKNINIIAVMFGLGNGTFVREMAERLKGRGSLVIYEPCAQLFYFCMEHYDLSDILENPDISLTVEGINDLEIKNVLNNSVDWVNLKSQIFSIHPQYDSIFPESLKIFHKIIQDNINRTVVNKNTDIAISKRLISNTLKNMKFLVKSNLVTDLYGKFPGDVPAIIVAAGPSLDKNIEGLKAAKGRAVIFAVDTAIKYLLAHDILPDFIVTLDPRKAMKHLSDQRCRNIPMFGRPDSRPENLEMNNNRIIFYNLEGYIKSLFTMLNKETGSFHSGGSVATGAFSICETLGFKRIILVGQDLAYLGSYTHAGNITVDVSNAGLNTETVEDIYGNPIKTRYDWYVYIKWFEDAVGLFEGEEVIDATEGGAKINGTTIMTLKEAIQRYCVRNVDCAKILAELGPAIDKHECRKLLEIIHDDIRDLELVGRKAHEALETSKSLISKYEKSIAETNSSRLKNNFLCECNAVIESKAVYTLVDWDMSEATTDGMAELYVYSKNEKDNKLNTYKQAKMIYEAIIKSVERIRPQLDKGYKQLEKEVHELQQT